MSHTHTLTTYTLTEPAYLVYADAYRMACTACASQHIGGKDEPVELTGWAHPPYCEVCTRMLQSTPIVEEI